MSVKSRIYAGLLSLVMVTGAVLGGAVPANAAPAIPEQAKGLFQKIVGYGASPAVAAGLLGNAMQESSMTPSAMQGGGDPSQMTCNGARSSGGGDAIGMFQWDSGRKNDLLCAAEAAGKPWTDIDFQLKFAFELEMAKSDPFKEPIFGNNVTKFCAEVANIMDCSKANSGGFKDGAKEFLKGTYPEGAAVEFAAYWERPGTPHMTVRVQMAKAVYDAFKGEKGTSSDSSDTDEKKSDSDKDDPKAAAKFVKERDLEGMGESPEWDDVQAPKDAQLSDLDVKDQFLLAKAGDSIQSEAKPALEFVQVGIAMAGLIFLLWSIFIFACAMFDKANTVIDVKTVRMATFGKMEYVEDREDEGGARVGIGKLLVRLLAGFGVGLILVSGVFFGLTETVFKLIQQ